MDRQTYINNLPRKQMAAGALFLNEKNELLILHPTYKDRFEIPGGIVENDESPKKAVEREIKEEIGLEVNVKQLLVCDYWHTTEGRPDNLQFIFYGGVLTGEQINQIRIDEKEIKSCEFVPFQTNEDKEKISQRQRVGPRVVQALKALENEQCYYLEDANEPTTL